MKVLVVTQDEATRATMEASLMEGGETFLLATDMAAALTTAVDELPRVAVVDLALSGAAGLALVHHLVASSAQIAVYALAAPPTFGLAAEAMSLGAAGMLVAPPTGDAVLRAVADVRARTAVEERIARLAADARDQSELIDAMTQAVSAARTVDAQALSEATVALFQIASGARGVAVFGTESAADGSRPRLAVFGTALELRDSYNDLELSQLAANRQGEILSLSSESRSLGCVLLEQADPARTARVHRCIEFASTLLPLAAMARAAVGEEATVPRSRALPIEVFERLVQREVDLARTGGAPLAILAAVSPAGGAGVDTGALSPALSVAGSALGTTAAGEAYVLMPKVSAEQARAMLLDLAACVGLADVPADGVRAMALIRLARARALESRHSPVRAHDLSGASLAEIADRVLQKPLVEQYLSSAFPLDLALDAARSVVLHAFRHALRAGAVSAHVAASDTARLAGAAADGCAATKAELRTLDVKGAPGCEGIEVLVVHGARASWSMIGRAGPERLRVVHSCDPTFAALLMRELERAAIREGKAS